MKDDAEQYRRLLEHRRARGPLLLDQLSLGAKLLQARGRKDVRTPVGGIVAKAAAGLKLREKVESAWQRVVPPQWSEEARVDRVGGRYRDTVEIVLRSSVLLYELGRQAPTLERQLRKLVPGVRRIRFVVAGRTVAHHEEKV